MNSTSASRIGVISDTHGLLREEALRALRGVELILHAGDIGDPEILATLGKLAPVFAVRGNNDREAWASALPERRKIQIAGRRFCLLHDVKDLGHAAGFDVVVSGHSHKPSVERRDGVLFLNPGSAGPRRFKLPVSLARVSATPARLAARIVELELAR